MSHLTEEQFEDIIQGTTPEPKHISECQECKRALEEKRALAERLHTAFASVKPNKEFAANVRSKLKTSAKIHEPMHHSRLARIIPFKSIAWPAAAALLIMAVIMGVYFAGPRSAMAAPAELVKIHQSNLADNHGFYSESDPEKLAKYLKEELGFSPSLPLPGQGMALRGCCVRHFRGQIAGSYVVDTPKGIISIVIVTDEPDSLGMESRFEQNNHVFYRGSFAKCNMVVIRLGDYSYCAVGEVSHEYLTELLSKLLPE
jgi:hypothetical protein